MKKWLCLLFTFAVCMFSFAMSESYSGISSIIPSSSTITVLCGEETRVDLKIQGYTGILDLGVYGTQSTLDICSLKWGIPSDTGDCTVVPLIITGISMGSTKLKVYSKNNENCYTLIDVDVVMNQQMIRFMGVDWYITKEEFDSVLETRGIDFNKIAALPRQSFSHWISFSEMPFRYNNTDIDYKDYLSYYESRYKSNNKDNPITTVAGYDVYEFTAKFVPSISGNKIGEPYRLLRAEYEIEEKGIPDNLSLRDVYADLSDKLIKLYGSPYKKGGSKLGFIEDYVCWLAEDGTAISMERHDTGILEYITIEYGVADDVVYINQLYDIIRQTKQSTINQNSENYEGL